MSDLVMNESTAANFASPLSAMSGGGGANASFVAGGGGGGAQLPSLVTSLPSEIITKLKEIFQLLDQHNCGFLNVRELAIALSLADYDCTPEERTGLVAVHCADKDQGLSESEFISICDVIHQSRKDDPAYSTDEKLRRAFDALASHEHGVVPLEGVLGWGDAVMKACEECLLVEHGFDYNRAKNRNLLDKMVPYAQHGGDDDDDDDDDGMRSPLDSNFDSSSSNPPSPGGPAARELKFSKLGGTGSDSSAATPLSPGNIKVPLRLQRRRSSSAMLVPHDDDDGDGTSSHKRHESPAKGLKLPEVYAQQQQRSSGIGGGGGAAATSTTAKIGGGGGGGGASNNRSPIATATEQLFTQDDIESTSSWLLGQLSERYKHASEGEKREIEMMLELARAAGHSVETVNSILTRDAFVKFMLDPKSGGLYDGDDGSGATAAAEAIMANLRGDSKDPM